MTIRQTICCPIPLHDGNRYIAQLVVPRDLTQAECEQLCAVLRSLVIPPAEIEFHEPETA